MSDGQRSYNRCPPSHPIVEICIWTAPSCDSLPTKHPMAHQCRERAPSTTSKPVKLRTSKFFPVCPRKRTFDLRVHEYTPRRDRDASSKAVTPLTRYKKSEAGRVTNARKLDELNRSSRAPSLGCRAAPCRD